MNASLQIDPSLMAQLWRLVRRRVRHAQDAEDIVQDVLLKLHARGTELNDEHSRRAWVMRVARNEVINHYRRRRITGNGEIEALAAPVDRASPAHEMKCLRRMLNLLPAEAREALILADEHDVPQAQIAQRYGVTLSGAKSRVQRARKQLRAMVLDCCDVEFDARGGIVDYQPTGRSREYCAEPCAA